MAIGLVGGAVLARLRHFRTHGWLQGGIAIANAVLIAIAMIPSVHGHLSSSSTDTRVVLIHAIAGTVAELLGLYLVVSAGLGWLPQRLRFTNYKIWMRTTLAAWLLAFGLGAWVYNILNGGSAPIAPAPPSIARITVKNFGFDPPELAIAAGTEVEWTDQGGRHSVQADDGSFKSGTMTAGGAFKYRFERPGIYPYFCEFHGAMGRHDMAGVVIVR